VVTAAPSMAAAGGVRDVARLLSALAASARAEAAMRQRVEANRARTRTSVRTVAACTGIAVVGLVAFKRPYLAPYATGQGQVVLTVVCLAFAGGLAWLAKLADYGQPQRFLVRRSGGRQL
jgi:tight adherence protein B